MNIACRNEGFDGKEYRERVCSQFGKLTLSFKEYLGFLRYSKDTDFIPISQNHRMIEVGKVLWRSSGPAPLLKQGQLQPVTAAHGQRTSEYL